MPLKEMDVGMQLIVIGGSILTSIATSLGIIKAITNPLATKTEVKRVEDKCDYALEKIDTVQSALLSHVKDDSSKLSDIQKTVSEISRDVAATKGYLKGRAEG